LNTHIGFLRHRRASQPRKKPDLAAKILPGVGAGERPDLADIDAASAPSLVGADKTHGQAVQIAGADDVGDIGRGPQVGKASVAGADAEQARRHRLEINQAEALGDRRHDEDVGPQIGGAQLGQGDLGGQIDVGLPRERKQAGIEFRTDEPEIAVLEIRRPPGAQKVMQALALHSLAHEQEPAAPAASLLARQIAHRQLRPVGGDRDPPWRTALSDEGCLGEAAGAKDGVSQAPFGELFGSELLQRGRVGFGGERDADLGKPFQILGQQGIDEPLVGMELEEQAAPIR
jgi:hypothetical protein